MEKVFCGLRPLRVRSGKGIQSYIMWTHYLLKTSVRITYLPTPFHSCTHINITLESVLHFISLTVTLNPVSTIHTKWQNLIIFDSGKNFAPTYIVENTFVFHHQGYQDLFCLLIQLSLWCWGQRGSWLSLTSCSVPQGRTPTHIMWRMHNYNLRIVIKHILQGYHLCLTWIEAHNT